LKKLYESLDFYSLLNKLKIRAYVVELDMHDVQYLITDLNLSTSDAIHLVWAALSNDFFVTGDRHFFEVGERVRKPRIVRASALHTFRELRA
jgi:predicted nucleic acid-binding protein